MQTCKYPFPISVLVTTHNALDYLKLCVDSLQRNARLPIQIVIYADGSLKATHEYLQTLPTENIKWRFETQNVGISAATNRAAKMADGEYLYLVNDDMVFAPAFDEKLWKHAQPNRVLTGTMIEPRREGVGISSVHIERDFGLDANNFDAEFFDHESVTLGEERLETGVNYPFLIRRDTFFELGAIDERFSGPMHDPDLFVRFAAANLEMLRVRDSLCYHFGGRSLRFDKTGETERVSPKWITMERDAKIAFVRKWGERPRYRYGGVPSAMTLLENETLLQKLRLKIVEKNYRRKAARRLATLKNAGGSS